MGEEEDQLEEAEAMYHVVVAEVLRELGYHDRAEESYMKAVSMDPWNSHIRIRYSAFLAHTGRVAAALSELEDVLAAEPGNTFARLNYALALEQNGDFGAAAAHVRECLRADPTGSELWCTMGRLLERDGQTDAAIGCYQTSIAFNGENQRPHYELGTLYLRRNEPVPAEVELFEAVLLDPQDPGAARNYGMALEQNGSVDSVEVRLRGLVAAEPRDATARYRYGLVLEKLGRLDEAGEQYAAAASLDPSHTDACIALVVLMQRTNSHGDAASYLAKVTGGRLDEIEIEEIICRANDPGNMLNAYLYYFEP